MEIKLAIAEDHRMIIKGIEKILADYRHIQIVGTYINGEELLSGLEQSVPDVLLLDIQMPGKSGDKLIPVILKKYPALRILVLTNFDSTFYAKNVLSHGALGYLLKSTDEDVLIKAIETVYEYKEFIEDTMKVQLQEKAAKIKRAGVQLPVLTPREKEVIQLIADGYTNKEIGEQLHIGADTAENYRYSLLMKLGAKNTAALVKKAILNGIVQ